MQIKVTTDYAIRIVLYLSTVELASSQELSDKLGISKNYISKLMSSSHLKEFVGSKPGKNGGLFLKKKPADIYLIHIVEQMEPGLLESFLAEHEDKVIPNCASYLSCCSSLRDDTKKLLSSISFQNLLDESVDIEAKVEELL